jgi:hypothetical protein
MGEFKRNHSESLWETQGNITLVDIGTDGRVVWRSVVQKQTNLCK